MKPLIGLSLLTLLTKKLHTKPTVHIHRQHIHGVNTIWREIPTDTYGDTHQTATPSIWFQQTVSLSKSIAMARHLINARNRLSTNDKQTENDIHGTPPHSRKQNDDHRFFHIHGRIHSEPCRRKNVYSCSVSNFCRVRHEKSSSSA